LRSLWALLRLLIFFLRHFQRCLPRFFQARELLFMRQTPLRLMAYIASFLYSFARRCSGPVGNFGRLCAFRTRDHWLSPDPWGTIEGQCYIQTKPPAHLAAGGH